MLPSPRLTDQSSDKQRIFEILAVVVTAIGKIIFMDLLNWRLPFILSVILFWTAYVIIRSRRSRGALRSWGFRTDNFKSTFFLVLPFAVVAVALCIAIGLWRNTLNITWHILPVLIVYPVWGVLQQFLVIAVVGGNLKKMKSVAIPFWIGISLPAVLFGMVHYPYYWLVLGTFLLAMFYGFIYRRSPNVWVMGILHGWLGAIFFYTVVNRDPFVEVF